MFFRKTCKCTVCAAGFKLKDVLRRHEQTYEEKYICVICHANFNKETHLDIHIAEHINRSPSCECTLCRS